jgi:hypothetical protein
MSDTRRLLARVRGRMALGSALEDLQLGLAVGAVAAFIAFGLRALAVLETDPALIALGALALAAVAPLIGMMSRHRPAARVASDADRALGLEERLSTALWCEKSDEAAGDPLGGLVQTDANETAATVTSAAVRDAFRPRLRQRPMIVAGIALAACALVSLYQPIAEATETTADKKAREHREDLNARIARKLKEAAERVEAAAKERKLATVQKTAQHLRREAQAMSAKPLDRQKMLTKLNDLRDHVKAEARKAAGLDKDLETAKATEADKALSKLLRDMAAAGLETLQKDLADLERRLSEGENGDNPPSRQEIQAMAARIEALKRAVARAEDGAVGEKLREQLQSMANKELLDKIAQKLSEIAQRMSQGEGYENLQSEGGEGMSLSDLSAEELEQLLKELEELAAMDDLEKLLQQAGGASAGGRKLKLGGRGGT